MNLNDDNYDDDQLKELSLTIRSSSGSYSSLNGSDYKEDMAIERHDLKMNSQLDSIKSRFFKVNQDLELLKEDLNGYSKEMSVYVAIIKKSTGDLIDMKEQLNHKMEDVNDKMKNMAVLSSTIKSTEFELESVKSELREIKDAVGYLPDQITTMIKETVQSS